MAEVIPHLCVRQDGVLDDMAEVIQDLCVRQNRKRQSNADEEMTNRARKRKRKMQEYLIVKSDL